MTVQGGFFGFQLNLINHMEQEILQLEQKIQELTKWKDNRIKDRLTFPIDIQSKRTLNKNLFVYTGKNQIAITDLITDLICFGLIFNVNGKRRAVLATFPLLSFVVNAASDIISNSNGPHNLINGDAIVLTTTDTLPAGLSTNDFYYIINRTNTTFQVSLTKGGAAVNIINTGVGTHYYGKIS